MEWGRAKQFVIVLLVLLNIVLAGLNYKQKQETAMTSAQERAIFEVLSRNGITMYTDILTKFAPMPRMVGEIPSYSKETMERLFFGSQKTTAIRKGDAMIYRKEGAALTLRGSVGVWEDAGVLMGKAGLERGKALQTAKDFLEGTEHFFGTYADATVLEREDGFEVLFCGTYKQDKVFTNTFSVFVTKAGIRKITFDYCPIKGYQGEKKDICYSDEALLTFMREWRKEEHDYEATIHRIELGYGTTESGNATGEELLTVELEPFYRIYLMEEEEPYLINAYTCQMVK